MKKILVVEDDVNINEAVCEYLRANGYRTVQAFDGEEAVMRFAETQTDLIVLDIMLPVMSGLTVLRSVRKTSQVPVLLLTALDDEPTQVAGFDALADDYMTKPFSLVILGKRVSALLRRTTQGGRRNTWRYGSLTVDFGGYTATDSSGPLDVTAKELDLLRVLVEHSGLVLSRSQILDEVWGESAAVLDRLVDTYIKNLRKKLRLDCIRTVKGIGYKLETSKNLP